MADQSSQQQVKKPLHHHNQLDMDELSVTLIERRKRLHELASEINQWEDEETKRLAHATAALMNQSPSTNTTMNNTTTTPFAVSPSPRLGGLRQTSPSPHHYHLTPTNNNKENRTPTNSVGKPAASAVTPGSNEILSVAKRILTKKQSSSEPTALSQPSQTVKSIASKFETLTTSGDDSSVVVQEKLTPRSIIQKFEKMASGGSAHSALNSAHKKPSENNIHKVLGLANQLNNATTPKHWIRPQQHRDEDNNEEEGKDEDKSDESSNKPRSIIEKFESLVHQQQYQNQVTKPMVQSTRSQASGPSPASTHASNSTSLTYVSSVMEAVNCGTNEYCDYDGGETNRRIDEEGNETSLFEDDDEVSDEDNNRVRRKRGHQEDDKDDRVSVASTFTNTTDTNRESSSYSISGSSYTAEMMNQDEFDDVDEDDYDSIDDDEMLDSTANTNNITSSQAQETDVETTITTASTSENQSYVSSIDETTVQQQPQQQPLMSLKDYRKQTKTFRSGCGRRRSSIMPAPNSNNVSHSKPQAPNSRDRKKSHLATIGENNGSGEATPDNSPNNARYMDRIKDLEELIKQEDNTIRQTKDAIECCLNDPQFTGSSQHIECNRLLLISCQKKQAFMTEANRLRSLLNSKQASSSDISPYDLSAVLVVSDIQIPVKESFLNKVKSGEDKRQFHFICIIRNGIQVIQTQLVNSQELLNSNEKSLIFPNRIAVSNVDINFRLKVDIYEMEIQPKDQQPTKRGKHSSLHQSKFFVSPFKSSNFSQVIHNTLGGGHSSSVHHHGSSSNAASIGAKTSQFIHIDTVEITKKDLHTGNNLKFKLNLSSSSIPLIGVLSLSVRCVPSKSIELKGFMTLFEEDASGLGTWDRRWCFLNNLSISYWKYPEDEYRSGPLGTILLTMCVSEAVSVLPRDLCARRHTIELLVCVPPDEASASLQQTSDNVDLSKCRRYRLSADTKEQANDWITNINHALANLRLWNPKAMKPIKK